MGKPKPDRFDEMLANWRTLLPQFRDKWGRSNCPLTAEAVWKYFQTGKIAPAPALLSGATLMAQCGDVRPIKREEIRPLLVKKGHGAHAVVTVNPRGAKEHSVVVVNTRGVVYLVDAYNPEVILAKDVEERLSYGKSFEITEVSDIHLVPSELVSTFRCRPAQR